MRANKDLDSFVELIDKTENDFVHFDELLNVLITNFGSNSSLIKPYFSKILYVLDKHKDDINNVSTYEYFVKGLFYFLEHKFLDANIELSKARELFYKCGDLVLSHFCDTVKGIVYRSLGELDLSLEHFEKGIINFENDRFPKLALVPLYQLGLAYYKLRDYEQSKSFFNEALKKATHIDGKAAMVRSLLGLADLSKREDCCESWYSYLEKALKIVEDNELGAVLESKVQSELAMYYLDRGNYKKAMELERKGLIIREKSGLEDQMITSIINLGKIAFSEKCFSEARIHLERAEKIAERIQVQFKIMIINRYLTDIYEELGMFKEALSAFKKHDQMNTELIKEKENLFYKRKNKEVKEQKELVESIHHQLKSSIDHAKYIQDAMLPSLDLINKYLPQSFIFFQPKDNVSGDFYWFSVLDDNKIVIAAVDCTGHGVPGAMMSMKADALLTKVVKHTNINTSGEILKALHTSMVEELHQAETDNNDGMDLSLCIIDFKEETLDFAGANNPLLIVREDGEMEYIRGDRNGIGGTQNLQASFTSKQVKIEKGMKFYLFTDGYQDQFGGAKSKKFMRKSFFELLVKNANKPFPEQKNILKETLNTWMTTDQEDPELQIDDILVIGFSL